MVGADGEYEQVHDTWDKSNARAPPWTGSTIFYKKGSKAALPEQFPLDGEQEEGQEAEPWPEEAEEYLGGDDLVGDEAAEQPAESEKTGYGDPTVAEQRRVEKLHRAFGHPAPSALARMLTVVREPPEVIRYARTYKCPACELREPPPNIPKTTMPYRPTRFNHTVGIDLKFVQDSAQEKYVLLNILDLATTFQVCVSVMDKSATATVRAFEERWINWAGVPDVIVFDKGTEYLGSFRQMVERYGIATRVTATESPWQQGMVERHGGVAGDIIEAVALDQGVTGREEMEQTVLHALAAKNRRPGRTGFSPRAMVFGCDERLPGSILSHRLESPDEVSVSISTVDPRYQRSMQIREAAMKAVVMLDHDEKWREGIARRLKSEPKEFFPGNLVLYWQQHRTRQNARGRRRKDPYRWHGPAVVIGREWDHRHQTHMYWISHAGVLQFVAADHLKPVKDEHVPDAQRLREEVQAAAEATDNPRHGQPEARP
jgi:transposase InsO family protein